MTVNRFCGSSMQSVHIAAGNIQLGAGEAFICAGVESMTRVPVPGFNPLLHPVMAERFPQAYMSMGETAENVAEKYKIPRERQEELAVLSHQKAAKAQAFLQGRSYATPHDVKTLAPDVLRHRIILSYEAEAEGKTPDDVLQTILDNVPVP